MSIPPPPPPAAPPPPPGGGPPPPPPPSGGMKKGGLGAALSTIRTKSESGSTAASPAVLRGGQAFVPRGEHGFAGLYNQASTCYMNSLIQGLFFTPTFLNGMTNWRYIPERDGKLPDRCIPLQLQALFARMKLSDKAAVDTKQLTKAFGWEDSDAFHQQDANELRLKLFEALEKTFQREVGDHPLSKNYVDSLFRGKLENVRKCGGCNFVKKNDESYLDLNIPVRGATSIEEGLSLFLEKEKMEGDNAVFCSNCEQKCDTEMGIEISTAPTVLTLSLRRFDYDLQTWMRVKLNHSVSFPFSLDISSFLSGEKGTEKMYELFGVLVHSGGAQGGHYYAFMKDIKGGNWLKVDDANVTKITEEEVKGAFGTPDPGKGASLASGGVTSAAGLKPGRRHGSAYMLIYHSKDSLDFTGEEPKFPEDLVKKIAEENEKFQKEKEEYEIRRDTLHLKVFITGQQREEFVGVHNKRTVAEGIKKIYDELVSKELIDSKEIPYDCVRLRDFNPSSNKRGKLYEQTDERNLLDAGFVSMKTFFLETKKPDEEFEEVETPMAQIPLKIFNSKTGKFEFDVTVLSLPVDASISFFKDAIVKHPDLEKNAKEKELKIARIRPSDSEIEFIQNLDETNLEALGITEGSGGVCVEFCTPGESSEMEILLSAEKHTIEVQYSDERKGAKPGLMSVFVDERKPVLFLKQAIADAASVDINEFLLCRRGLRAEYKQPNQSIKDAGIYDQMQVAIVPGTPLGSSQYKFKIFIENPQKDEEEEKKEKEGGEEKDQNGIKEEKEKEKPAPPAGPPPPGLPPPPPPGLPPPPPPGGVKGNQDFLFLGELVINVEGKVAEIKENILKMELPPSVSLPKYFRLREKVSQHMGQILRNDAIVSKHFKALRSGMELVLQPTEEEDSLGENDLLLSCRLWLPEEWEISKKTKEVVVKDTDTVSSLKNVLAEVYSIPLSFLAVAKAPGKSVSPFQIAGANWEPLPELVLTGSPWYMKSGDSILLKDRRHKDKHEIPLAMRQEREVKIETVFDEDELRLAEQLSLQDM